MLDSAIRNKLLKPLLPRSTPLFLVIKHKAARGIKIWELKLRSIFAALWAIINQ